MFLFGRVATQIQSTSTAGSCRLNKLHRLTTLRNNESLTVNIYGLWKWGKFSMQIWRMRVIWRRVTTLKSFPQGDTYVFQLCLLAILSCPKTRFVLSVLYFISRKCSRYVLRFFQFSILMHICTYQFTSQTHLCTTSFTPIVDGQLCILKANLNSSLRSIPTAMGEHFIYYFIIFIKCHLVCLKNLCV